MPHAVPDEETDAVGQAYPAAQLQLAHVAWPVTENCPGGHVLAAMDSESVVHQ